MTEAAEIWANTDSGTTIWLGRAPSDEVLALLSRTVWGNRETRYRILDLGAKLARLRDPYVFSLFQDGKLAAACILDRCEKRVLGSPNDAFHFVMAATESAKQGRGFAGLLMAEIRRFCERTLKSPGLAFAYIEASQKFSLRISDRIGHAIEADLSMVLFSRLIPKADGRVGPAVAAEGNELVARLDALYADHELADFESSVRPERMLVLKDSGRIAAAAQLDVLHWSVASLPGWSGRALLRLLPYLPVVKRVLDPRDLRVLKVGNALVEPGQEAMLVALLETALAQHRTALALLMMDTRSPVLNRILDHGKLGVLRRALPTRAKLRLDFLGHDEAEVAEIAAHPMLVSPADVF